MKEILERLLEENREMLNEIKSIPDGDYKTGYTQALLNMKSSIEWELWGIVREVE
jgi:hypothetical protein